MSLLGADIEQISRLKRVMTKTPGFLEKVFTDVERSYCEKMGRPAQHYAARFCAKEAFAKALGTEISWKEVEVVSEGLSPPLLRVYGDAAEKLGSRKVRLTLSHAGDYAIAMVLVEDGRD